MTVFLSYHNSRSELVTHVAAYLNRHGVSTWYAPHDIPPGAEWDEAIADALTSCTALVLLFDASADSSKHVKREITLADHADIPIRWLRLEDVAPVKLRYYLMANQWIDWLDQRDAALESLVRSLAPLQTTPAAPTAAPVEESTERTRSSASALPAARVRSKPC